MLILAMPLIESNNTLINQTFKDYRNAVLFVIRIKYTKQACKSSDAKMSFLILILNQLCLRRCCSIAEYLKIN